MKVPSSRFEQEVMRSIEEVVNERAFDGSLPSSTEKGKRFCTWALQNVFGLASDEAENAQEAAGPGDTGIDAIFNKDGTLYVVQVKYGSSHKPQSPVLFAGQATEMVSADIPQSGRDAVLSARVRIKDALADGEQVEFAYVTQGRFRDPKQIQRMVTDWQQTRPSARLSYFGIREIADILRTRMQDVPEGFNKRVFTLELETDPMEVTVAGSKAYACSVPLRSLAEFVRETEPYLYVSNIRQYLKRTLVNKRIEETLATEPELFWAYNNGLTIMCRSAEPDGLRIAVRGPQLLNGCQTACSIRRFFKTLLRAQRQSFRGSILVRLLVESEKVRKNEVTRYTNSQNAVRGKDFLALDQFQRDLHNVFANRGFYYEVQRGAYSTLPPEAKARFAGTPVLGGLVSFKYVPSLEAIQGYASAFHRIPHVAGSSPSDLLPGGAEYSRVFPENLSAEDCWEEFLYPFAVVEFARDRLKYGRGGNGFRRYAKWLFVQVVFDIVAWALRSTGTATKIDGDSLRILMEDRSFVETVAQLADQTLDDYLSDSTIRRKTNEGLDERQFLQGGCGDDESRSILEHRVLRVLGKYGDSVAARVRELGLGIRQAN